MKTRILAMALLLVFTAAMLSACGTEKNDAENGTSTTDTASEDKAPAGGENAPGTGDSEAQADLDAFMEKLMQDHDFSSLMPIDNETAAELYPGLADISVKQQVTYMAMISVNTMEFAVVELENEADADAVKAIFQARIDGVIEDSSFYPSSIEKWEQDSEVVSTGSYVMMVVHPDHEAVVEEFNAFFQ